MAVSKHQNERPAIIDLIDSVNEVEPIVTQNVQNIAALTEGLADEAEARAQAIQEEATARAQAIQEEATARAQAVQAEATARAQAVQGVQNQIGEGTFSSDYTITQGFQEAGAVLINMNDAISNINQWQNLFRFGITQQFTVAPNDSHTGVVTFDQSFGADAQVLVLPNCVGQGTAFGTLECKLIDATYSGFSFEVNNSDSDNSYTLSVGFVAVQVN